MSHTFLSLDMELIPQETKDNVPTFYSALFSNDNSRMLIDGRNGNGELVHPMTVLLAWTQWSANPSEAVQAILDDAIEYTAAEFNALRSNIDSIWYVEPEAIV